MGRKIAIIGSANSVEVGKILIDMRDYEKWAMNNLFLSYPNIKFTRWFELHNFQKKGNDYSRRGANFYAQYPTIRAYLEAINGLDIPVYMQKHWKIVKKSIIFPFNQIMEKLGTQYFGCSFAWMLGLGLLEHLRGSKVDEIRMMGIGLQGPEYYFQRPSTEYYLGIAQGMGIKVNIDRTSTLLTAPFIYAYKENFSLINVNYVTTVRELVTMMSTPMQEFFERTVYGKTSL
jgi:hypothetical protein